MKKADERTQKILNSQLSRSDLYILDAERAGFTKEQAIWLHNEFYDLKAI